ncbi:glycosyltransferase [Rhizobium sp. RAF36]|uniref:glycosyltransferase n=1 Tax=Rhizobium sp. RAF36 TaxID=3233055 RepID=UPI003F98A9B4
MNSDADFAVFTRANDLGETGTYLGVPLDVWHPFAGACVQHSTPSNLTISGIRRALRETRPDVIYINSLLSRKFSLLPLIAARLERCRARIVLAPRGELSPGALGLKRIRKKIYLSALRASGLLRNVVWQASSPFEATDIRSAMGNDADIVVAADLPSMPLEPSPRREKAPGEARIIFVGRISPMKNLVGALAMLRPLSGKILFSVIGPVEDLDYWEACKRELATMPENIRVEFAGPQKPQNVLASLSNFDVFFLPSLGENYAHVVFEALGAGCPVVISDRTPWKDLAGKGIGADIALERPELMSAALQKIIDTDEADHARMRHAAAAYARSLLEDDKDIRASLDLLGIRRR